MFIIGWIHLSEDKEQLLFYLSQETIAFPATGNNPFLPGKATEEDKGSKVECFLENAIYRFTTEP